MIETNGKREPGKSVLAAQHDDDYDLCYSIIFLHYKKYMKMPNWSNTVYWTIDRSPANDNDSIVTNSVLKMNNKLINHIY